MMSRSIEGKIIASLQFLWAHLKKKSNLSGRLRPCLCFLCSEKKKNMFMLLVGSSWQTKKHSPSSYRSWLAVPCYCTLIYYSSPPTANIDILLLSNTYCQKLNTNYKFCSRGHLLTTHQLKQWTPSHQTWYNILHKALCDWDANGLYHPPPAEISPFH